MTMRSAVLVALLFAAVLPARAQLRAHVEVLGEYHTVPSLRAYEDRLADALVAAGLDGAETVQAYPPFVGLRLFVGTEAGFLSENYAGIVVATGSTGARTAYRDAESALYVDDRIAFRSIGVLYEVTLGGEQARYEARRAEPFVYAQPLLEWTRLRHEERLVDAHPITVRNTYQTLQGSVEVGGGLRLPLRKTYVRAALGAYWRLPRPLTASSARAGVVALGGTTLRLGDGDAVQGDGFGVRLGIGFGLAR